MCREGNRNALTLSVPDLKKDSIPESLSSISPSFTVGLINNISKTPYLLHTSWTILAIIALKSYAYILVR